MKHTDSTAKRLDLLVDQVEQLQARVDRLTAQLTGTDPVRLCGNDGKSPAETSKRAPTEKDSTGGGMELFLPRVAAICFMLVAALVLRTVTDSGIIDLQLGSFIGVAYAVALIAVGWRLYRSESRLASVFPACGLLLLFTVVIETHARFESLSTGAAYGLLVFTMVTIAVIALRYNAGMLLSLGILGGCLAGMAIDFPYVAFPLVGLVFLLANSIGYLAARRHMCPSLRWIVLILSMIFLGYWAYKLNVLTVACEDPTGSPFYLRWFFPFLFFLGLMYPLSAMITIHSGKKSSSVFDSLSPPLSVACAFYAGRAVAGTWYIQNNWFDIVTFLVAIGLLGIAAWLAKQNRKGAPGVNVFVFASFLLFLLSLPYFFGQIYTLPVLSVLALWLCFMSRAWNSGGVRATSYFFQLVISFMAAKSSFSVTTQAIDTSLIGNILLFGMLSISCLFQYRWCRMYKPVVENSEYFSWLDKKDVSAIGLLLAGLLNGFCMFRLVLYGVLTSFVSAGDIEHAFRGGQSIIIDVSAVLLMLLATRFRNREILFVAAGVSVLGAIKVFILDLFGINGLPLVFSVFSYGLVAASWSIVLKTWKKTEQDRTDTDLMSAEPVRVEVGRKSFQ